MTATLNHANLGFCVDWHPDGIRLATACKDRNIYLWDTVRTQQLAVLKGHTGDPVVLAFSHAGNLKASRGWDQTLRLWDVFLEKELVHLANGVGDPWQFSPDDHRLAFGAGIGPR